MKEYLITYCKNHGISYVLHKHAPAFTVAESEANPVVQKIPGVRGKTLFLVDEHSRYYLVGMPGKKRLEMAFLKQQLEVRKLSFASVENLYLKTGLTPGNVSIFGIVNASAEVTLILDKELWEANEVAFHPNQNDETLELDHASLENFFNSISHPKRIIDLPR